MGVDVWSRLFRSQLLTLSIRESCSIYSCGGNICTPDFTFGWSSNHACLFQLPCGKKSSMLYHVNASLLSHPNFGCLPMLGNPAQAASRTNNRVTPKKGASQNPSERLVFRHLLSSSIANCLPVAVLLHSNLQPRSIDALHNKTHRLLHPCFFDSHLPPEHP